MARAILSTPRVLRTGQPLALAAIKQVAPAVFAEEAHSSRGERYLYVPTIKPLELMLKNGWGVFEASQQRSRAKDRDPYTKHMLRLRKLEDFQRDSMRGHAEGVPEVVLINAHDGTAAYTLFAGFFRFICSNGLIVGQTMGGFKVRHTKGPSTSMEVLEAGERTVTEKFPLLVDNISRLQKVTLKQEQQYALADRAVKLRYGTVNAPFSALDLLTPRRDEDKGDTAWAVLNRVQENIIDGGWKVKSQLFGRTSAVRAVERVSAVAAINCGLWDTAIEMVA